MTTLTHSTRTPLFSHTGCTLNVSSEAQVNFLWRKMKRGWKTVRKLSGGNFSLSEQCTFGKKRLCVFFGFFFPCRLCVFAVSRHD